MDRWLAAAGNCPTCRVRLDPAAVTIIHTAPKAMPEPVAARELANRFGSKTAALVRHLQQMLARADGSKAIVFSMWDDMLHVRIRVSTARCTRPAWSPIDWYGRS